MILSDFLSRQIDDNNNLHEIIPISFNIWEILQESYHSMVMDTYKVQTRAQAKAQANASTVVNTQPVAQKAVPKIIKLPSESRERIVSKCCPAELINNLSKALHCPQNLYFSQLSCPQILDCH